MIPHPAVERTAPFERITETIVLKGKTKLGVQFTIRSRSDGRVGWSVAGNGWSCSGSGATRRAAEAQMAQAIAERST